MILTTNLKMLRAKHSKTQKDIADILGISIISYRQKENNIRSFTLDEAKIISDYFNLSVEAIFFTELVYKNETA